MSAISVLKKQIKDYVDTADERTLEIIHRVLEASEPDPLDSMTEEDMAILRKSLRQAAKGNVIPHAEVKKNTRNGFPNSLDTPLARTTFFNVIEYLNTNFTEREINPFIKKTDEKIDLIVEPNTYRRSTKVKNVHYTNIMGKVMLLYQIMPKKKQIVLIKFWGGRQNPKKFKY